MKNLLKVIFILSLWLVGPIYIRLSEGSMYLIEWLTLLTFGPVLTIFYLARFLVGLKF